MGISLQQFLIDNNINQEPVFDGQIHRFSSGRGASKSGWYIGFDDTRVLIVGDFKTGEQATWSEKEKQTDEEREETRSRLKAAQAKAKEQKLEKQKRAKRFAEYLWSMGKNPVDNAYLANKKIQNPHGARAVEYKDERFLAIPLRDIDGELSSIQKIYPNGSKRFLSGGKITGCFFKIQGALDLVYITEGYATGCSIHEATGATVLCAMYATNIESVYLAARTVYPHLVLATDNDQYGEKNTGLETAKTMSVKHGLPYVSPEFKDVNSKPTDFNDLMVLEGAERLREQLTVNQVNLIGDDAIEAMVSNVPDEIRALWAKIGIGCTQQGNPIINELNILKIICYDDKMRDAFFYDDFSKQIIHQKEPLNESDILNTLFVIQGKYGFSRASLSMVRTAIESHAYTNRKNQAQAYLKKTKWDGTCRVAGFFRDYCSTPDSEYTTQISVNWWVSIVARVLDPGCKVDNMVVLEGKQGARKSSMLEIIGGDWYCENTADVGQKDFYQNLEGAMIVEIAELDSFSKAGVNTIKRILSSRADKYRPAYGRYPINSKRQCVFVGTTNEREYLKDNTGGRRFWPIKCVKIDLKKLEEDRDQLFAEAVHLYKMGQTWWDVPNTTELIQENRRESDPWEPRISRWIEGRIEPFTTSDLMTECLDMDISKQDRKSSLRIAAVLRNYDFKTKAMRIPPAMKVTKVWITTKSNYQNVR